MPIEALKCLPFTWWSNVSFSCNIKPRCLCADEDASTGVSLKIVKDELLVTFGEEIESMLCILGSRLNGIFYWYAQFLIKARSKTRLEPDTLTLILWQK